MILWWHILELNLCELLEELRVFAIEELWLLICVRGGFIDPGVCSPLLLSFVEVGWAIPCNLWLDWHRGVYVPVLDPVLLWIIDEVWHFGLIGGLDGVGDVSAIVVGVVGIIVICVLEPVVVVGRQWVWFVIWVDFDGMGSKDQEGGGVERSHYFFCLFLYKL